MLNPALVTISQQRDKEEVNDDDEEEDESSLFGAPDRKFKIKRLRHKHEKTEKSQQSTAFKSTNFLLIYHLLIILVTSTMSECNPLATSTTTTTTTSRLRDANHLLKLTNHLDQNQQRVEIVEQHASQHDTSRAHIQQEEIKDAKIRLDSSEIHRRISNDESHQRRSRRDDVSHKVAALATKLDQWLQCYRRQLFITQIHFDAPSNQQTTFVGRQSTQSSSNSDPEQRSEPEANCPPQFDGHLCWPETLVGQHIRLPCPRINFLSQQSSTNISPQYQQQSQLKTVIDVLQRQQGVGTPSGGDINQTQEITAANLQSIKPTGIRAGITTPSINQQPQNEPVPHLDGGSSGEKSIPENNQLEGQHLRGKFAQRSCLRPPAEQSDEGRTTPTANYSIGSVAPPVGKWQKEADYSECSRQSDASGNLFDPTDEWVKLLGGVGLDSADLQLFSSLKEQLERIEVSIDPYNEPDLLEQWTACISEVMRQQREHKWQQQQSNSSGLSGYCPIIFDGWRCWPATKAGEIAYVNCPKNQPGFSAERKAYKICTLEADWYRHPQTNRYWSNYTTCVDTVDLAFRTKILNLYVIGNSVSLIALAASLIVFVSFKNLNCTRVTIHKNLFLSFITNNLMWIIWYTYVVNDADLLQSNPIECRFWHILLHYFLVSNYFWMFCEGLYLHTLLVVAFVSEDKILKWFYLLGWLTPVPIVVAYAYQRSYDAYYTNFCWMEESPHNIILMAPIGISLLLNLIFLINIVRVLVTKLRANNSPDTHQTRKAVRATLILIPLLGLHYMLTPFRPDAKSEWEVIYEIIAAVCTSFQGLCVAMLFCFCNGEVINAIKKKLKDSFLFNQDSKRAMRSRSNTAISNVFTANSNHHNNGTHTHTHNHHHHHHQLESCHTFGAGVSSSSSNGNLMTNQLQGQTLMMNRGSNGSKALPLALGNNGHLASQRSSVLTTSTTNASPVHHIIETELVGNNNNKAAKLDGQPPSEETMKLLDSKHETNNNQQTNGEALS